MSNVPETSPQEMERKESEQETRYQAQEKLISTLTTKLSKAKAALEFINNSAARETNGKAQYEGDVYGMICKRARAALKECEK